MLALFRKCSDNILNLCFLLLVSFEFCYKQQQIYNYIKLTCDELCGAVVSLQGQWPAREHAARFFARGCGWGVRLYHQHLNFVEMHFFEIIILAGILVPSNIGNKRAH